MSDYECTECGADVNEAANFCPNCGERFDETIDDFPDALEMFECSSCLTEVDDSAVICPNCGEFFE